MVDAALVMVATTVALVITDATPTMDKTTIALPKAPTEILYIITVEINLLVQYYE